MKVVNVRYEKCDVYVGRGRGSDHGNPIKFGETCLICGVVHRESDRNQLVECYRRWLWIKISKDIKYREKVKKLNGKVLGCWCAPKRCHADILVAASKWLEQQ